MKNKIVEFLSAIKDYLRGDAEVGVFLPARRLWSLAGTALVQAIVSIGGASMLSHYLNGVYQTGAHGWALWSWAIGAAIATGAQLLLTYNFSRRLGALRARAEAGVRSALFQRLHAKDMPFFRENESKGLATRHDDDVETLIKKNLDARISVPANLIKFGVSLALLIHISLIAGGSVFLMLPLISVLGAFWGRRADKIAQDYSHARKEVGRQGQEPLEMIATVKANGQEDAEAFKYHAPIENLVAMGEKQAAIDANAHVSASAVTDFFAKNLIYIIGAFMLAMGVMPIGSVVLMLAYAGFIESGATGLSSDWLSYSSARGETATIYGWLTEKLAKPANLPVPAGGGAIGFEGVSFRYWENGTGGGVEDVNLSIRPGETVAFVGESGSGKSTLLKIFQNLWQPKSGRVTLEGVPVGDLSPASFGSVVASVAQETPLFYDTLRYNMVYGTPHATDAELAAAIKAAQAGFVDDHEAFPKGLDTMVGEGGAQLSGGQRQRVAIVRALLKRPRVLLFDEATSDLDKETEIAVKDAVAGMTYGADGAKPTTLIVAHNLTTIRNADRIVVMSAGRIVEIGTHDALLERNGAYARLWHIQSQAR